MVVMMEVGHTVQYIAYTVGLKSREYNMWQPYQYPGLRVVWFS